MRLTDRKSFEIVGPGPKSHLEYVGWRYGYSDADVEFLDSAENIWEMQATYRDD